MNENLNSGNANTDAINEESKHTETNTDVEVKEKTAENTTETEKQNDDWVEKLGSILDKRLDGFAKKVLKDNGIADEEISEIITQYKANKADKTKKVTDDFEALKAENEALKRTILDGKINESAVKIADQIGIDTKYIKQVIKLADLSEVTKTGKVDETKLNEAMAKVVAECEVFKRKPENTQTSGFQNIGGNTDKDAEDTSMDKIRRAMGLA